MVKKTIGEDMLGELPEPGEGEVAVDYIKGRLFRPVWMDGVAGNVTPRGLVRAAAYVERHSIPRRVIFEEDASTGELGKEVVRHSRDAVVREMGCDLMMSADVAERVGRELIELAQRAREMKKASAARKAAPKSVD